MSHKITSSLAKYRFLWPGANLEADPHWFRDPSGQFFVREMPEGNPELAADSRWPAFFPCSMCIITTSDGTNTALEKVVGASIVNRFPYIVAVSFCMRDLSARHHRRSKFMELLEQDEGAAVQFLQPGEQLDRVMKVITGSRDNETSSRIAATGLPVVKAKTNKAPVFTDAYLVYEARMIKPGRDMNGRDIFSSPSVDVGSHRIYFMEVAAIQLRQDIAEGRTRIAWRSLPAWQPQNDPGLAEPIHEEVQRVARYEKEYTPHYLFPSKDTIAYSPNVIEGNMAVKFLPPQTLNDVTKLSDDDARWPCFFPSSVGMITTLTEEGVPNLMPCGSTTIVSRQPLVVAICVCYANINVRYAPRGSLEILRKSGKFGCGVAYFNDAIVNAIKYAGNNSITRDCSKLARTGLVVRKGETVPILPALPISFECEVMREEPLGTHSMFLGEIKRVLVRTDVTPDNPLEWYPWADLVTSCA